jgi:hypothetical protein
MPSGIKVSSPIIPFSDGDSYPTHYSRFGAGGFTSVNSVIDRNSISFYRQETGMLVYVINDKSFYTLLSESENLSSSNWEETRFEKNIVYALNGLTGNTQIQAIGDAITYNSGNSIIIEVHAGSGDFITRSETGNFATANSLLNYLPISYSGYSESHFYPRSNPSGYVNGNLLVFKSETGNFATKLDLNNYYLSSNPNGYLTANDIGGVGIVKSLNGITGHVNIVGTDNIDVSISGNSIVVSADLISGNFVEKSETGVFALKNDLNGYLEKSYSGYVNNNFYLKSNGLVESFNGITGKVYISGKDDISISVVNDLIVVSATLFTGDFVERSETGQFASYIQLNNFLPKSYSGVADSKFYLLSNPNQYIAIQDVYNAGVVRQLNGETGIINIIGSGDVAVSSQNGSIYVYSKTTSGDFVLKSETGQFATDTDVSNLSGYAESRYYLKTNPSNYLTSLDGVLKSETGQFASYSFANSLNSRLEATGNFLYSDLNNNYYTKEEDTDIFYPRSNPSGFLYTGNIDAAVARSPAVALNTAHRLIFSGNPHGVTHDDVGSSIAYWNASQIEGKDIDTTQGGGLKHLQVLKFDAFRNEYINTSVFSQQEDLKQRIYSAPSPFLVYEISGDLRVGLATLSSDATINLVFSNEDKDYYTTIPSKFTSWEWQTLYNNKTNYLYIERDISNSSISYGFTDLLPHKTTIEPTGMVNGQTWYDLSNYIHYIWLDSVTGFTSLTGYNGKYRLYVGEAIASNNHISSTIEYAVGFSYVMSSENVTFDGYKGISALNVNDALKQIEDNKLNKTGDYTTGNFQFFGSLEVNTPILNLEAANKLYVDNLSTGLYTIITGNQEYLIDKIDFDFTELSGNLIDYIDSSVDYRVSQLSGGLIQYEQSLSGNLYNYLKSSLNEFQDDVDFLESVVYEFKNSISEGTTGSVANISAGYGIIISGDSEKTISIDESVLGNVSTDSINILSGDIKDLKTNLELLQDQFYFFEKSKNELFGKYDFSAGQSTYYVNFSSPFSQQPYVVSSLINLTNSSPIAYNLSGVSNTGFYVLFASSLSKTYRLNYHAVEIF